MDEVEEMEENDIDMVDRSCETSIRETDSLRKRLRIQEQSDSKSEIEVDLNSKRPKKIDERNQPGRDHKTLADDSRGPNQPKIRETYSKGSVSPDIKQKILSREECPSGRRLPTPPQRESSKSNFSQGVHHSKSSEFSSASSSSARVNNDRVRLKDNNPCVGQHPGPGHVSRSEPKSKRSSNWTSKALIVVVCFAAGGLLYSGATGIDSPTFKNFFGSDVLSQRFQERFLEICKSDDETKRFYLSLKSFEELLDFDPAISQATAHARPDILRRASERLDQLRTQKDQLRPRVVRIEDLRDLHPVRVSPPETVYYKVYRFWLVRAYPSHLHEDMQIALAQELLAVASDKLAAKVKAMGDRIKKGVTSFFFQ